MEGTALSARDDPRCLAIMAPVAPADTRALCERAREIIERRPASVLVCDVGAADRADLALVEALARVLLTARRLGCTVRLRRASVELVDLVGLVGLRAELPVEVQRQAEEREEPGGVEEEGDPRDAPI